MTGAEKSPYSPGEILSYFEAALFLLIAYVMVRRFAFHRWESMLGDRSQPEGSQEPTPPQPGSKQVKRALKRLQARRGPKYTCLMFTIAGNFMLRRRGLSSEVAIGVRLDKNAPPIGRFGAHSWLSSNGYPVFGHSRNRRYNTIALYRHS